MKDLTITGDHINRQDSETISEILYDALGNMGLTFRSFGWSIEVTVDEECEEELQ